MVMVKRLREPVDLRVVRCTSWAYQRIAQECANSPVSLSQAIDKLLKELDGLRAEMKPRLMQEPGSYPVHDATADATADAHRRYEAHLAQEAKLPPYALEVKADGSYRCKKCRLWHPKGISHERFNS